MGDKTLEAVIKLKDEISKPLNNIQNEMRDLNKTSDDVNGAMKDIQRRLLLKDRSWNKRWIELEI